MIEIASPAPEEHEQAALALQRAKATCGSMTDAMRHADITAIDLGRELAEIVDKNWCRLVCRVSTEQWVTENLRNADNSPMSYDQACTLIRDYRTISQFPAVEALVRRGQAFRTSAFYACATAALAAPPGHELAALQLLREKSGKQLREGYYALKNQDRTAEPGKVEWVPVTGAVPREVIDAQDELLESLKRMEQDHQPLAEKSLTWKVERLVEFGQQALDACKAHLAGDSGPLESLVESVRGLR